VQAHTTANIRDQFAAHQFADVTGISARNFAGVQARCSDYGDRNCTDFI